MSITLFNANQNPNANPFANGSNNQSGEPKPKSKIWLSVGKPINGKFISLPLDQGIDTMRETPVRGQNEEFVKQITAQNDFLKLLQQLGAKMQPGQEQTLNLEVRIRRVNEALVVDKRDNEFTIDAASLLFEAAE